MKFIKLGFVVLITFLIISCEGDQGEPGPAGPAGPQGPQGTAVNVSSFTFPERDLNGDVIELEVPAITQNILDKGFITGYVRETGSGIWYPLPIISGSRSIIIRSISLGRAEVFANFTDSDKIDIRIVVVKGTSNSNL